MNKIYNFVIKIEEMATSFMLASIMVLMFSSALFRKIGFPINWANDVSLLFFSWLVFLGADLAIREKNLVNIDMLLIKLPLKAQKIIRILCQIAAIIFLLALVRYGFPLCLESISRKFSNMELSYSWATASVPVGCLLISMTSIINLIKIIKSEDGTFTSEGGKEIC